MFHPFCPGNASSAAASAAAALAAVPTLVPTAGCSRGRVPRRRVPEPGHRRCREDGQCDFLGKYVCVYDFFWGVVYYDKGFDDFGVWDSLFPEIDCEVSF